MVDVHIYGHEPLRPNMHQPFRRRCNNGRESAHVGKQPQTSDRLHRVIHYRFNKSRAGAKLDT